MIAIEKVPRPCLIIRDRCNLCCDSSTSYKVKPFFFSFFMRQSTLPHPVVISFGFLPPHFHFPQHPYIHMQARVGEEKEAPSSFSSSIGRRGRHIHCYSAASFSLSDATEGDDARAQSMPFFFFHFLRSCSAAGIGGRDTSAYEQGARKTNE